MKKTILSLAIIMALASASCTDNTMARRYGGTATINLPKGQELIEVTWKGDANSLWYLTKPMDKNYTPTTKTFQEDSRFGLLEGKVIFVESR